jgi:Fe-S-cluster containining protein
MKTARQKKADTTSAEASPMPCRRCGVCCKRHQACVRPEEIQRIIAFLGITMDEWTESYDDPRWKYNDYSLIRQVNGACAFLQYDNGLATCAIYTVRPTCCADWQPGMDKKECKEGMGKAG